MPRKKGSIGMGMLPCKTKLGRFIRSCRIKLGLSQSDLEDRIGFSFGCISHLETGKKHFYNIKDYQLERLAEVLKCNPRELRKLIPEKCQPKTELGRVIHLHRKELGMSIEEFARRMNNISLLKARKLERYTNSIDADLIKLISETLNLDAEIFAKFKKKSPETKLGKIIRKRRKELRMSIYVLAEKLDITKQAVSQIELGEIPLSNKNIVIEKLAEILKLEVSKLMAARPRRRMKGKKAPNPLIEFLIKKRLKLHLTQRRVGDYVGTTSSSICLIEKGKAKPTIELLEKIAEALNCQLSPELILPKYLKLSKKKEIRKREDGKHGNLGTRVERKTKLGNLLTTQRVMQGLTQAELGKKAGISTYVISKIECGVYCAKPSTLKKIAEALDCKNIEAFAS